MTKGTIEIEYESEVEDPTDPMSDSYFGIVDIRANGSRIKLRHQDLTMLESALSMATKLCTHD